MRLLLYRPELANRDCQLCLQYAYTDDGPSLYRGQLRRRVFTEKPDCRTPKGCPKGTPERPETLSPANQLCYNHYLRCRATGQWPDDALVAYHARILAAVEQSAWLDMQLQQLRSLSAGYTPMPSK